MWLRTVLSLVVMALAAGAGFGVSPAPLRTLAQGGAESNDALSGEWEGRFEIGGGSAIASFKLKLEGDKVTGTVESAHTGPGTVSQGSLVSSKVNFTLNFAAHESIVVEGVLKDGQLSGEFRTEGMVGTWTAKRKSGSVASIGGAPATATTTPLSAELIAGEWEATFEAHGTKVPVTLKFKVDADQVSGTSDSAHLGAGKISKGTWKPDKLNFVMEGGFGSVTISGALKEGKLVGEFDMGAMHGAFEAKKK